MLSADDEQGKHLDDQHTPLCVGKPTKEQWDRLQEQTALLHERLWFVWETTLELINRRYQIAHDHQYLRLQRQHLLEQQIVYLQDIPLFY